MISKNLLLKLVLTLAIVNGLYAYTLAQVEIPEESLKKHVYVLADDSLEGRGLGTEGGRKAARYIVEQFKDANLQPVGDDYFHPFYAYVGTTTVQGRNIVGMVEGSDPELKNEYIVLGAHYDHISYRMRNGEKVVYNGADDNATGTSAIIEIGRALYQNRDKLKRSVILVAFDGEESGLLGSWKFVEQEIVPVENIKLMMSIDMVGRYAESNSLIMGAMGTLKGGNDLLDEIAKKHGINIKRTGKKISNRTDSKGFGMSGIPALHVTSGIVGPYHKPEDDAETIDYEGMSKIAGLLYEVTTEVANKQEVKAIARVANYKKNDGLPYIRCGMKIGLGNSYLNFPDEFYQANDKFSAEAGFMVQFRITKNISFQPELVYSTMGSAHPDGNFRLHSISTPVSLVLATKMNKDFQQRFFVNFGGYYSYHFIGEIDGKSVSFTNDYEQMEYGLVYGVGLEMMSFVMHVQFKHGLSNLLQDESVNEFMNKGTYLTIGYMF